MEGGKVYHRGLHLYGKKKHEACSKVSSTCKQIKSFKDSSTCSRCVSKLVFFTSGSGQYKHVGPVNDKLRAILPLKVHGSPKLYVGEETVTLELDKFVVIDDSFENAVVNDKEGDLLLLVIDFNHPDLTDKEKKSSYSLNEYIKSKFVMY